MTYYSGKHLVICDRCGFKKLSDEVRKEWTGLIVCRDTCWEPKHPQLLTRAVRDNQAVRDARPEPTDHFLSPGDVTADDL